MTWDFTFTLMTWDFLIMGVICAIIAFRADPDDKISEIVGWFGLGFFCIFFAHMAPQMLADFSN